jgi:hypothetical protein
MKIIRTKFTSFYATIPLSGYRSEKTFEDFVKEINRFSDDCSRAYEDYPGFKVKDIKYHTFEESGWTNFTAILMYEVEDEIDTE